MAYEKPVLIDDAITNGGNQSYGTATAATVAVTDVAVAAWGIYLGVVYVAAVASEIVIEFGHGGK